MKNRTRFEALVKEILKKLSEPSHEFISYLIYQPTKNSYHNSYQMKSNGIENY